jgi:hypothetical protein
MGVIAKGAAGGIVFGAVCGIASYNLYPRMSESEAQQYTNIEACAQQLPEESTPIDGYLPEHCQRYSVYIGSFVTPKPEVFRSTMNERVTTDEEIHERNVNLALGMAAFFGLVGVAAGTGYNARRRNVPSGYNRGFNKTV